MDTRKVAVLVNVAAGKADAGPQLREIEEAFAALGVEPKIWPARSGADLKQAAKEAIGLGFPVIVAAGGDGTVSKVADTLAGSEAALGILPTGTLNHFAKDLNLPLDIGEAAATITEGHTVAVDAGRVNDKGFINNASIGVYPQLITFRERMQKKGLSKWMALIPAALAVMVKAPARLRVRLSVEGKDIEMTTNIIFVGNNEYEISGLRIGIRKRVDQGVLSLYLSRRTTRRGLVGLLFRALLGNLRRGAGEPDFDAYRAQEFWIDSDRKRLETALDGELVSLETPLHFRAQPRALKVIVKR
ncbi:MAG: diacylglycerol kinase family protein [Nitrospirota bacterium]